MIVASMTIEAAPNLRWTASLGTEAVVAMVLCMSLRRSSSNALSSASHTTRSRMSTERNVSQLLKGGSVATVVVGRLASPAARQYIGSWIVTGGAARAATAAAHRAASPSQPAHPKLTAARSRQPYTRA